MSTTTSPPRAAAWIPAPSAFHDRPWHAHWVTAPDTDPDQGGGSAAAASAPGLERVILARRVHLDAVPVTAPLRLSADSRYELRVNGLVIGRGPVRSQPRRRHCDEHDIAAALRPGENTLTVLVTYYGRPGSFWRPAHGLGSLGRTAALVLEADLGDAGLLITDETWRVLRPGAWTDAPSFGLDGVPVETCDARLLPADWDTTIGDDWPTAVVRPAEHSGGHGRSVPPVHPFNALAPRPVGPLGGATLTPTVAALTVLPAAAGDLTAPSGAPGSAAPIGSPDQFFSAGFTGVNDPRRDPVEAVRRTLELVPPGAGRPVRPDEPVSLPADAARPVRLDLDLGRIVCGLVDLPVRAPAGTRIDLAYAERVLDPRGPVAATAPRTGARYLARGEHDGFRAQESNGLRHAYVLIVPPQDAPPGARIEIGPLAVHEQLQHWTGDAHLTCDDPEIETLYLAGRRSVELNTADSFTDCPTREQRAWVGDGIVHTQVHLTCNSDWRPATWFLDLADAPRDDGLLPMSVAGDIEHDDVFSIPDWSLHWVHALALTHQYTGDDDLALRHLPTAARVLRWFTPYTDPRGTLTDVPEWNLADWSSVLTGGRSAVVTGLWARGLRDYADLAETCGEHGSAAWARRLHQGVVEGFEDFWDPRRARYVDALGPDGAAGQPTSQLASALAVVAGLAPRHRWHALMGDVTDPARVVQRSWIGGTDGGYDTERMRDEARGVLHIDWDVETQVVRAQPFASYLVHDALAMAGRADDLVTLVRDWSVFLADGYDTFGECWGWGTPVHGWSACPSSDLVRYVLGVTPAAPGFTRVRIAPAPGGLGRLEGSAPTPFGPVRVAVRDGEVHVSSPVPVDLVTGPTTWRLPAGEHRRPW